MIPFPDKKYQIIYADPPWSYNDESCSGSAQEQYNTMKIEDICNLPVNELADSDCVLFMWATYPLLPEALDVIKSWGFKYKSIAFQWIKLNSENGKEFYGLGRWTRGNTEPCLLATKGKPHRINPDVFQIIRSPLKEHSKKPSITRSKIIHLMGDIPRIELFSRDKIEGWDCWGNEVPTSEQKLLRCNE
jgi:site-specific DNA-methyltransferase (adenine-specific)